MQRTQLNPRMKELRNFYPGNTDDGTHRRRHPVQAIEEDGDAGIVHFGTEVISDQDKALSALLGASPGASVSTNIILEIVQDCFGDLLKTDSGPTDEGDDSVLRRKSHRPRKRRPPSRSQRKAKVVAVDLTP